MPDGGTGFSQEDIDLLLANIDQLDDAELTELESIVSDLAERQRVQRLRDDLIAFCCHIQDDYKVGAHHRRLADLLEDVEARRKDRICVSVAPRHGKSQLVSIYYAAWYMGRNPSHKVMLVSHTTDLAVDFGRKIRNLIATEKYREVFPDVALAVDSKSAGRWNTNHGGEFFACIAPDTTVVTPQGPRRAEDVRPGDRLQSSCGFQTVQSVMETSHEDSVTVNGTTYSLEHPIWTMSRGWVAAGDIYEKDLLLTESFLNRLKAVGWETFNGLVEHPYVSALVQHQVTVPKSEKRKVSFVRRTWHFARSTVGAVSRVLCGYGGPSLAGAYGGAQGQRRAVFAGELPLGDTRATGQQQTHNGTGRGKIFGATCAVIGIDPRGVAVSDISRHDCRADTFPREEAAEAPRGYGPPKSIGWARRCAAWLLAAGSGSGETRQPRTGLEGHMARMFRAAGHLLGMGVGVCCAGSVTRAAHRPRRFVNFRIAGDNTFFANGTLTHNCGVGSALAGRGAHMLLIDDPHSEQDILNGNYGVFDKAYEWFTFGARTRLMPGGAVAIVATRWAPQDLIGRVVGDMTKNEGADQYDVFEFPAILDTVDPDTGAPTQKALWPEFFDLPALLRTKASMPVFQWNAQYQQSPTSEEAAVIKREWWRQWERDQPPPCDYIIMSLDAAAETHNRADYTSLTVWGVFLNEEEDCHHIILLHAIKDRFEFPELKRMATDEYARWEPDAFIVEKKSAGVALYQEMRRTGLPVQEYTPHRGSGDKMARLNSVADIISSGLVWVPDRRWAEEVVEEIAAFPFGPNDDHVDSTVQALLRFRQGGFIALPTDEVDEPDHKAPPREGYY
tara:strand:+ start:552 stop:3080 length:2529 start_codon:yes stop_codon:yes gene_type:complete